MIVKKTTKTTKKTNKPALLESIIESVKDKKGKDIVVVDLREITSRVCDYFVICNADSNTHVQSIARGVEDNVKKILSEKPFSKEGLTNSQWVLIDYVSVVVHILETSFREYYNLEGLWADATITHYASE